MGKIHLVSFEDAPIYELSATPSVQDWFIQRESSSIPLATDALLREGRDDTGARVLVPGDALRLIIAHRRDDMWSAICRETPAHIRREWGYGAGQEHVWNHDLDGFRWFAKLPGGPGTLAGIDLGTAIEQAKVFCKSPEEYSKRQEVLSVLMAYRPNFLRNNPKHWDYIINPSLPLMELCCCQEPMPLFTEKHFAHMRSGTYEHFQILRTLHGGSTPALWNEMRRFAAEGPKKPADEDKSYAGMWNEPN